MNYNSVTKSWMDSSGNGRNISTANVRGTPTVVTFPGGYADSTKSFQVVQGDTADGIRLGNPTMANSAYTFISVARYVGGGKAMGRIFDAIVGDYLTGFWNGRSGVAHHDGWVTSSTTDLNGQNWFIWVDQGSRIRNNGVDISRFVNPTTFPGMSINYGSRGEYSAWQVAEVMLFDYAINSTQAQRIESYLGMKYGVTSQLKGSGMSMSNAYKDIMKS